MLLRGDFEKSKEVSIKPICNKGRFQFDNIISPWLNKANKQKKLNHFKVYNGYVTFSIDLKFIEELDQFNRDMFEIVMK